LPENNEKLVNNRENGYDPLFKTGGEVQNEKGKRRPQSFTAFSKLGQQLLDMGLINATQLEYALEFQKTSSAIF
jgi:hypothetical protein